MSEVDEHVISDCLHPEDGIMDTEDGASHSSEG